MHAHIRKTQASLVQSWLPAVDSESCERKYPSRMRSLNRWPTAVSRAAELSFPELRAAMPFFFTNDPQSTSMPAAREAATAPAASPPKWCAVQTSWAAPQSPVI